MTAIWPAGPPKLSAATRIHVQNASRSDTPCEGASAAFAPIRAATASSTSGSRLVARPIVGFLAGVAAPAIERVVKSHRRVQLREVIPIHA